MTPLELMLSLHEVCHFQTNEGSRVGKASNSELRRWIQSNAVEINGRKSWKFNEEIPGGVKTLVLFPKNEKKRCTLY